jgi:4'-phosphopantetheinyl transferase
LSKAEVHIWRAFLDLPPAQICSLELLLSPDERGRAERFRFERDRRRFIAGRGVLRILLGRYTGVEPDRIAFGYGAFGKPYWAGSGEPAACAGRASLEDALRFNLAHSGDVALYVLAYGREVGIDLEHIRPMPDAAQIARQFFSPFEFETWQALPEAQKQEAFFNCWTRKEAYLKATGDGMARPLDSFDVSLVPGQAARLLSVDGQRDEARRWSLETFMATADSLATVAVQGSGWRSTYLAYPPAEDALG